MKVRKDFIYYELLVLRCRRKDKEALQELVRTWEQRLFYYVRRLVDNEQDSWDILQQTWLHVIRGLSSLKEPRSLPAWLYRVARNTAMRHLRTEYRENTLREEAGEIPDGEVTTEDSTFDNAEQVHHALTQISQPHREVLTLYFLGDLSTEEIAGILDVPPGTVRSRMFYAKRALRSHLEKEDATDA